MRILFITSSRLGDAVLSTGLLDHITRRYPDARITVVCGVLPATLFDGMPGLEEVIILKKRSWHRHWLDLWRRVAGTRWDMVVDLRNSAVSRVIWARERHIFGPHIDRNLHKVEQNAAVMGLEQAPDPVLWFSGIERNRAEIFVPDGGPILGIGPTANWIGKTWPAERFIALIERLTAPDGALPGFRVAVFAAPGEERDAYKVLHSVPEDRRVDVIARGSPGTAAAALARCAFYIGNDSGLMHCAAAAGVPTLGLFGPSWPHLYRPWGKHAAYISTPENFAELTDFTGYNSRTLDHSLMTTLSVEDVINAVDKLLESCGITAPRQKAVEYTA